MVNDPFHEPWIILENSAKIWSYHCTCMTGMGETCNHFAAAMLRVKAAVRTDLVNPSYNSSANEWLLKRY